MPDRQPATGRPGGVAQAAARQGGGRNRDLLGQPGDEGPGKRVAVLPALAGMAQERDVHDKPEAVRGASSGGDQLEVVLGKDVVAFQGSGVGGDSEQGFAGCGGQKAS